MKNIRLRSSIYALVAISGLSWFILASLSGLNLSVAKDFFSLLPKVVTIDLFIIAVFAKWGWKLKCFREWLIPFPNLNGTWIGSIRSDWVNPQTGEKVPPIPVMLTINQSFLNISFIMHTGEMKSYSISEGFKIDNGRQLKQVYYIYTSKPRIILQQRSVSHDGAAIFDIIEKPEMKLKGRYWTERKTTGEIELQFYSINLWEEIPQNIGMHPMSV
ncbi:MAG: hypothetical protein PHT78_09315 [Desulfitobacteriaceae bacterium]|nr:hypothetical protein [Desulfitobacteriaceae bacterium]